jgi:hypothetical protein
MRNKEFFLNTHTHTHTHTNQHLVEIQWVPKENVSHLKGLLKPI